MQLVALLLTGLCAASTALAQDALGPGAAVQQTLVVKPPLIEVPQAQPAPVAQAPPQLPTTTRAPVITTCDAGGCWDSDGRRLNRAGLLLIGPAGACIPSGSGVQCP